MAFEFSGSLQKKTSVRMLLNKLCTMAIIYRNLYIVLQYPLKLKFQNKNESI